MTTTKVPVLREVNRKRIYNAFHRAADIIAADMFGLAVDEIGEFSMTRGTVSDYLHTHGGDQVVADYIQMAHIRDNFEAVCDYCQVPTHWC